MKIAQLLPVILALAACGKATPPAQDPESKAISDELTRAHNARAATDGWRAFSAQGPGHPTDVKCFVQLSDKFGVYLMTSRSVSWCVSITDSTGAVNANGYAKRSPETDREIQAHLGDGKAHLASVSLDHFWRDAEADAVQILKFNSWDD